MKPGNLLPGGLEGTPAQDALLKTDLQEKAHKAGEKHESYTPPMPSSNPFNGRLPTEVGMGESSGVRADDRKGRDASRAGDRARTVAGLYAA